MRIKKNLDTIITEKMVDEIIEGQWQLGMQLSLEDIMERYEVSRTPVIQALKGLAADGIVTRIGNGHYYCRDFTDEEVRDIIDIRLMLENEAVRRIIGRKGTDFSEIEQISRQAVVSNDAGDTITKRRLDLEFHRKLIDLAGSKCLSDIYYRVQVKFMMVNFLLGSHSAIQQRIACGDHEQLLKYLKRGDLENAEVVIGNHIKGAYSKICSRYAEMNSVA